MNRSYSKIRHIQESNLQLEKRLVKEALGGGAYDVSSIDKLKAKYPNGINTTMSSTGTSTFANGIDTINPNNPNVRNIVNTILAACRLTNGFCTKNVTVTVGGGASAVGSAQGYDNQALAKRRRDNFIKYLNGIDAIAVGTSGKKLVTIVAGATKVGKATVKDSAAAQSEQYVSARIKSAVNVDVTGQVGDNTNVAITDYNKTGPKKFDDDTTVRNYKRVCVKIPAGLVDEYKKKIKEFKIEKGLDSVPFGVYDVK
jgi:hypothetical protein